MKTLLIATVTGIAVMSPQVEAFLAENYVIIDNWAINIQPQAYEYYALIADSKANRLIQCRAHIGATNDRRFDKVDCWKHDIDPKGNLARYRVTHAPIDALRDPPYRNSRAAYWMVDPDSGKGEFCTQIDNQGPTCFDLPSPS
ncbi:hypothetical protein [Pseudomonas sp. P5_C3]